MPHLHTIEIRVAMSESHWAELVRKNKDTVGGIDSALAGIVVEINDIIGGDLWHAQKVLEGESRGKFSVSFKDIGV